jgi:hypothetical protein
MVTYPSLLEGFGNAFLESVYFRKPIVVNDYTIYAIDIKPKGFRAIELTDSSPRGSCRGRKGPETPSMAVEMAEHNFQLAKDLLIRFLEHQLQGLLQSFTGEDVER